MVENLREKWFGDKNGGKTKMKKVSLVVLLAFAVTAVMGFSFSAKAVSLAGGTVKDGGTAKDGGTVKEPKKEGVK